MEFIKKKKIAIIILILAIIVSYFLISNLHPEFTNYIYVHNQTELIEKVNNNFFTLENTVIEDEYLEKQYIIDMTETFFTSYQYLKRPFFDNATKVENLTTWDIAQLTYLFLTNGTESVCIEKKYFQEMVKNYFQIENFTYNSKSQKSDYDIFLKAFCFQKNESSEQNQEYYLLDYSKDGDIITINYQEIATEEVCIWTIQYKREDTGYYLESIYTLVEESETEI